MLRENEKLKASLKKRCKKKNTSSNCKLLQEQNKISAERYAYLKDMERKLKQIIFDWKKSENKQEVFKQMQALLFNQKEKPQSEKIKKKFEDKYAVVEGEYRSWRCRENEKKPSGGNC